MSITRQDDGQVIQSTALIALPIKIEGEEASLPCHAKHLASNGRKVALFDFKQPHFSCSSITNSKLYLSSR
jgi:hypothetical protein